MRFIFFNLIVLALMICAGLLGLLSPFMGLGYLEWAMLGTLGAYAAVGAGAMALGKEWVASHISHSLPILGLVMTGMGLLIGANNFSSLDSASIASIFHQLVFAISPNIVAVGLMAWLRELAFWVYKADL